MAYALIGTVVHVYEEFAPVVAECLGIHSIPMVLACYIAAVSAYLTHGLVV